MDQTLEHLYEELLLTKLDDGKRIIDRINGNDLCVAGHHIGGKYDNDLLVFGQAVNGWQNSDPVSISRLLGEIEKRSLDKSELYTVSDYSGWHGTVDGKKADYYYKRSKYWKLGYQVLTDVSDQAFNSFYVRRVLEEHEKHSLLEDSWPQTAAWSNLYKIAYIQFWASCSNTGLFVNFNFTRYTYKWYLATI